MKNLKKTLSLVLVAVMMLGILTIGAGAAFTDQTDVDYAEAVDVLSAIKVLEGFEDGSFKPDQILTREQAAKIVAYAMIGKTAADALTTGTAPFNDVAATRWSAGYITFCVNQGIINGYGDGRFGPADTLTGFQFAKMLLTALGYGKNDEFVGSNWTIEVAKLAIPLGIFDGNTDGASNAPCTREAAALYAFNAMTKCMTVNYAEALGIYYSGTNALQAPAPEDEDEYTLGYKVFGLERKPGDFGGRNGHYWTVYGVKITDFWSADTVVGTDTRGTDFGSLTTKGALGFIAEADPSVPNSGRILGYKVYYNGDLMPEVNPGDTVQENGYYFDVVGKTIRLDDGDGIANPAGYNSPGDEVAIGAGTTTELIDTGDKGKDVDVINVINKDVIKILADPMESFGTVRINGEDFDTQFTQGYEGLKKGDYALTVEMNGIRYYEKCDTVVGKLEGKGTLFGGPYYVINGNNYSLSALNGSELTDLTVYDVELVYYLDSHGFIVAASEDASLATYYYGLVLAAEGGQFNPITGTGAYAKAQILTQTGETVVVDLVKNGRPDFDTVNDLATALQSKDGVLVSYKTISATRIKDVVVASDENALNPEIPVSNFGPIDFAQGDTTLTVGGSNKFFNSSTYFFYCADVDGEVKYGVVKGYTSAPTVDGVSGYCFTEGSMIRAMVMDTAPFGSDEVVFITSADYTTGRLEDGTMYYIYTCFRDGKQETINLDAPTALHLFDPSGAFTVVKDPVTGLYTAERFYSSAIDPITYLPVPVENADETYFVCAITNSAYNISATTDVFIVTYGVRNAVIDVQSAKLVAPSDRYDVTIVAVKTTTEDPVDTINGQDIYNASAVYYRLDPK